MPAPQDARTLVAVREPEKHWNDFEEGILRRLDWKFIGITWAIATVVALVLTAIAVGGLALVYGNLADTPGTVGAMIPVVTTVSSFLAFVLIVSTRADHIKAESFYTCLAIAGLHIAVFGAIALLNLIATGFDLPSMFQVFPGQGKTPTGIGFFTLQNSAIGVLAACFISAGLIEAQDDTHPVVRIVPGHESHDLHSPM